MNCGHGFGSTLDWKGLREPGPVFAAVGEHDEGVAGADLQDADKSPGRQRGGWTSGWDGRGRQAGNLSLDLGELCLQHLDFRECEGRQCQLQFGEFSAERGGVGFVTSAFFTGETELGADGRELAAELGSPRLGFRGTRSLCGQIFIESGGPGFRHGLGGLRRAQTAGQIARVLLGGRELSAQSTCLVEVTIGK